MTGVIAQEVAQIFPELMHSIGGKFELVKYDKFVPVLIEAMKEQQKLIAQLQEEVRMLKKSSQEEE